MDSDQSREQDSGVSCELISHIKRANFNFDREGDYEEWKVQKRVFFSFDPRFSGDGGVAVLRTHKVKRGTSRLLKTVVSSKCNWSATVLSSVRGFQSKPNLSMTWMNAPS